MPSWYEYEQNLLRKQTFLVWEPRGYGYVVWINQYT